MQGHTDGPSDIEARLLPITPLASDTQVRAVTGHQSAVPAHPPTAINSIQMEVVLGRKFYDKRIVKVVIRRRSVFEGLNVAFPRDHASEFRVRSSMFNVVEKKSQFIGTYYCVYLGDWLVLQTKNSKLASRCGSGNPPIGLIDRKLFEKEAQPETEVAA